MAECDTPKRLLMKKLYLIVLCVSSPCFAQTANTATMPDGSRDAYVGLGLVSTPVVRDKTSSRETLLVPLLQVNWSNGIFVSGLNTVGMQLSGTPGMEYGPVMYRQQWRGPGNYQNVAGSEDVKDSFNVGGFFNYSLGQKTRFISGLFTTTDAPGLLLDVGIQKTMPSFAPHHTVVLSAGARFADRAYAQHYYGISANNSTSDTVKNYAPTGGLVNLSAGLKWNWALSASWRISTNASVIQYAPMAADSPLNSERSVVSIGSGLAYRF